jgi:hypothetical protein
MYRENRACVLSLPLELGREGGFSVSDPSSLHNFFITTKIALLEGADLLAFCCFLGAFVFYGVRHLLRFVRSLLKQ